METRGMTPLFIRTNENKMLNTFVIVPLTRCKSRGATEERGGGDSSRDGTEKRRGRRTIEITMARQYARAGTHNGRARGTVKAVSTVN